MITLNSILTSEHFGGKWREDLKLLVDGKNVWDFKEQNNQLRLIHEPLGVKEQVVIGEIYKNYGMDVYDLPIVSETDPREIAEVEILTFRDGSEALNFKLA